VHQKQQEHTKERRDTEKTTQRNEYKTGREKKYCVCVCERERDG